MKRVWIVLIALAAAVAYGVVSHAISGACSFSLAFAIGAVVALALSGFRSRPADEDEARVPRPRAETGGARAPAGSAVVVTAADSGDRPADSRVSSRRSSPDDDVAPCGASGVRVPPSAPAPDANAAPLQSPTSVQPALQTPGETAETLWERARGMVHNVIPDPVEDAEYLDLVISAAERGHVPALAKLGDYAFRRGTFVEAYFWTTMAKCRLDLAGNADRQEARMLGESLRSIRREWTAVGQPPEFENAYENFPDERGELGRAFLRLDSGKDVSPTRDYIKFLAKKGNPDAALFARCAWE